MDPEPEVKDQYKEAYKEYVQFIRYSGLCTKKCQRNPHLITLKQQIS